MPPTVRPIDRRRFLGLAATLPALAAPACSEKDEPKPPVELPKFRMRPLGRTGLSVSEVSFGAHGNRNPSLFAPAFAAGINMVMTSGSYLDGREEEAVGEALRTLGRRDGVVVATGEAFAAGTTKGAVLAAIDASLRRLRTDRIEVYCQGMVQTPADVRRHEVLEGLVEARRAGKVLHFGLSGHHGGLQECLRAAIDDGVFEAFLVRYDFVSYPDQGPILERAAERGIGVVVFKTTAGARQNEIEGLEKGGLSFPLATAKWALTNPYVSSVLVSITTFDQIRSLAAAVTAPFSTAEARMLRRYAEVMRDRYCRFCRTCEASCPHDVAVAEVNRYLMYFARYGREKEAMQLYKRLPSERSAGACERCAGVCDRACPFGRRVRAELVEAHRQLRLAHA